MVSPLNDNQIEFRISYEDQDYTVIYDKSSFSYKIIYVNDLKTDSENDNNKVNMPSLSSSEPTVEPTVSPQHIDEFLKNEASLSECNGGEQNVIYFNDLFPFNVIYPDELKSDKDNDNDKIDIKQSSVDKTVIPSPNVINTDVDAYAQGSNKLLETSHDTISKIFTAKNFIKELNFNIVTYNYVNKGMPFIFIIKNLHVPFGIPFDPKLFYKDGIKLGQV
ncbi:hypothetical protein Tco_1081001 [Tanacetum coccineum]|uniref:Uncharacterized protein n=1 Tax=Tanacetum coccineum TaxID=301880 RepID=A0ABQ5HXF9_9ASTR